jgi:very-short-patch-repair endonuclease
VVLHHVAARAPSSLRRSHGLTLTDPARTLHDLAALGGVDELARAVDEAQVRRLVTTRQLQPRSGARGAALLRAILDAGPTPTRSHAERRLVTLLRQAGLPRPETNVRLGPYEVDALWRDHRLIVEVDGFASHGTRAAFERDRRRDAELSAASYRIIRVTWRQLADQPLELAARLGAALG